MLTPVEYWSCFLFLDTVAFACDKVSTEKGRYQTVYRA